MRSKKYKIEETKQESLNEPGISYSATETTIVSPQITYTSSNIPNKSKFKITRAELETKINRGIEDYNNGRTIRKMENESAEEFLDRLCTM